MWIRLLRPRTVVSLAFLLAVAGCSAKKEEERGSGPAAPKSSALPASFALATEPAGAKNVKEVVASAKTGDEVTVVGRVGIDGSDRAYFTLVDLSLKSCKENMDECKTPWDFCCTSADEMPKVTAMVQFRDGANPIATNVLGFQGLDHLSTVVVKGKAEKDATGNLVVAASGIFVRK